MLIAWIASLIVLARSDVDRPAWGLARPAVVSDPGPKAPSTTPGRSPGLARRSAHRSTSHPWSCSGGDDADVEEVEETWTPHPDALATGPLGRAGWDGPRPLAQPGPREPARPPSRVATPLRC